MLIEAKKEDIYSDEKQNDFQGTNRSVSRSNSQKEIVIINFRLVIFAQNISCVLEGFLIYLCIKQEISVKYHDN